MTPEEIKIIIDKHQKWLDNEDGGERAILQRADLRDSNLQNSNLRGADLRDADLRWADLQRSDLRWSNLRWADLQRSDLRDADLQRADLRDADLRGANWDYSCLPLHCGGSRFKSDMKFARQLLAHLATLDIDDPEWPELKAKIMPYALKSHRAGDLGLEA